MEKVDIERDGIDPRVGEGQIGPKKIDLVPEIGALIVLSYVAGLCSESESLIPSFNVAMLFLVIPAKGLQEKEVSAAVWLVLLVASGCTMALASRFL